MNALRGWKNNASLELVIRDYGGWLGTNNLRQNYDLQALLFNALQSSIFLLRLDTTLRIYLSLGFLFFFTFFFRFVYSPFRDGVLKFYATWRTWWIDL